MNNASLRKLNKADRALLEKLILARRVKDRSNATKKGENYQEGPLSPVNTIRALKKGYIQPRAKTSSGTRTSKKLPTSTSVENLGQSMNASVLDSIDNASDAPDTSQLQRETTLEATTKSDNPNPPIDAEELMTISLTPAAAKRMLTNRTRQKFQKMGASSDVLKLSDRVFLPKKTIVRPDGATLMDVYESKKKDLWGKIIQAQYKEDEENKHAAHAAKLKRNHDFGVTFRKDLEDIRWRREHQVNNDEAILKIVEAKSKAQDDIQQQRKRDAIARRKQFIANCLEDIETKRKQREEEMNFELKASAMMIEKNKFLIQQDKEKAEREKEKMKQQMDDLWREGQELIAKKQKEKEDEWAYVAKIQREAAIKADKEEKRRQDDLAAMLTQAKDGPAHAITDKILKGAKAAKDRTYQILLHAGNGLNGQLLASDEAQKARSNADYGAVMADNDAIAKKHEAQRKADHEFNLKMGQLALKRSLEFQAQERKNREDRIAANLKYQKELDEQVHLVKNRKLHEIQETMIEEERKMNMALFRRYPQIPADTNPGAPSDKLKALRKREQDEPRGPEVKIGKFRMT